MTTQKWTVQMSIPDDYRPVASTDLMDAGDQMFQLVEDNKWAWREIDEDFVGDTVEDACVIRKIKGIELPHTAYVEKFLNALYAIMVDPLEDGTITVEDLCTRLKAAALRDRDATLVIQAAEAVVHLYATGSSADVCLDGIRGLSDAMRVFEASVWVKLVGVPNIRSDEGFVTGGEQRTSEVRQAKCDSTPDIPAGYAQVIGALQEGDMYFHVDKRRGAQLNSNWSFVDCSAWGMGSNDSRTYIRAVPATKAEGIELRGLVRHWHYHFLSLESLVQKLGYTVSTESGTVQLNDRAGHKVL